MATIQTNVRWADNTAQLTANLKQGIDTIDAMRKSVDRTAASLGGQGLLTAANRVTAAILDMGTVSKLTRAEQERNLALLDKAIEKYRVLGQTAPTAMRNVATSLRQATSAAKAHDEAVAQQAASNFKLGEALRLNIPIVGGLSARFSQNISTLGALGGAIGTVVVGYEVLRKAFDIADKIGKQASAIRDLSQETGIAIEPLQILGAATKDFGVTTEDMARGVYQLSRRIATGDDSASAAFRILRLDIEQLKNHKPEEIFLAVVRALNTVPDQLTRSALSAELFGGKLGSAILRIGPDLDEMIRKVKDAGEFMSDDAVKGADDFADAIEHLEAQTMALLGNAVGPTMGRLTDLLAILRRPELSLLGKIFIASQFPLAQSLAQNVAGSQRSIPPMAPVASHGATPFAMAVSHGAEADAALTLKAALEKLLQAQKPLTSEDEKYLKLLGMSGAAFAEFKRGLDGRIAASKRELEIAKAAAEELHKAQAEALAATVPLTEAQQAQVITLHNLGLSNEQVAEIIQSATIRVKNYIDTYELKTAIEKDGAAKSIAIHKEWESQIRAAADNVGKGILEAQAIERRAQLSREDILMGGASSFDRERVQVQREAAATLERLNTLQRDGVNVDRARAEVLRTLAAAMQDIQTAQAGFPEPLAAEFKEFQAGADRMHSILSLIDQDLSLVGQTGRATFDKIIRVIRAAIQALQEMLVATLSENAALAAQSILKGIGGGLAIGLAFVNTGGLITPRGVQHFDAGGIVSPFGRPPNSKDTMPIWAMPGEMYINPQQQARLMTIIDGDLRPMSSGHTSVVEHHYHTHNWDLRQAVVTNEQGIDRLARQVAKRSTTYVAQNKDSVNTRGRAGYGLKS